MRRYYFFFKKNITGADDVSSNQLFFEKKYITGDELPSILHIHLDEKNEVFVFHQKNLLTQRSTRNQKPINGLKKQKTKPKNPESTRNQKPFQV